MISYTGPLWPTLGWILGTLAAIAALIAVVILARRRRRPGESAALNAAMSISGMWISLSALGLVVLIVKVFTAGFAELSGQTNVWLPWPDDLPCSDGEVASAPSLGCSGTGLSDFTVYNAPLSMRFAAALPTLVGLVYTLIPALMVAVICWQTLRGAAFTHIVPRTLFWGAGAVAVVGVASDLVGGITATTALRQVFPPESEWYPQSYVLTVSWAPFLIALALAALAAVFRQGMVLQAENERLARDTEGLV
ncbi:hypothetical protein [Microbacterium sp. GXF6406]